MSSIKNPSAAKILFFGTPEFAVPTLRLLARHPAYSVLGVVTQADKPAGRGAKLRPSAIKIAATELDVPVFQPLSLKKISLIEGSNGFRLSGEKSNEALCEFINENSPFDAFVTAAYGKIIPSPLLHYPRLGMINIHPSLLPRWRGAAPLQWALFSGDEKTGVSIMKVDEGLDTGPVYGMREVEISENETLGALHDRLASLSADFLVEILPEIISGRIVPTEQTENGATYAEKWDVEDQTINWEDPVEICLRRIQTCAPIPGARTSLGGEQLKVFAAHIVSGVSGVLGESLTAASPGTILEVNREELVVAAGPSGFLCIDELQFPGKKRLATRDFLLGRRLEVGMRFC